MTNFLSIFAEFTAAAAGQTRVVIDVAYSDVRAKRLLKVRGAGERGV